MWTATFFLNGMGGIFEVLLFLLISVGVVGFSALILTVIHLAKSPVRASNLLRYSGLAVSALSAAIGMAMLGSNGLGAVGAVMLLPIILSIIAFIRDRNLPTQS